MVDLKGRLGECGKQGGERKESGHSQKTGREMSCGRDVADCASSDTAPSREGSSVQGTRGWAALSAQN